jgi:hypothetical protein
LTVLVNVEIDILPSDVLSVISTHCPNLRCLNLGGDFSCEDSDVISFLQACPKLQLLSIFSDLSTEMRLMLLRNFTIPLMTSTCDNAEKVAAIETICQFTENGLESS